MKKSLHRISFYSIDCDMSTEIDISRAEYETQFMMLTKKLKETSNNECPMEYHNSTTDLTSCTITRHFFTLGTAETTLTEIICKEGYTIKNKTGGNNK